MMTTPKTKFSILIATKNRIADLAVTLENLSPLLCRTDTKCIICDDGSTDGTFDFIVLKYPQIHIYKNEVSKGYLNARNTLLKLSNCEFAISLDDDAHFLSQHPLEIIEKVFAQNPDCGLIAFRIFWGLTAPELTTTSDGIAQVRSFVGCGHVWRMQAWSDIPQYPEWFQFYGEEDFASYQLFKMNWKVLYVPAILVQHRVDQNSRRTAADYHVRLSRSLTSGWALYFLFIPLKLIPRKFFASLYSQISRKIIRGDFRVLKALMIALVNLIRASGLIHQNANRLTSEEYYAYRALSPAKIYWNPNQKGL